MKNMLKRKHRAGNVSARGKSTAAPPYPPEGRARGPVSIIENRRNAKEAGRAGAVGDRGSLERAISVIQSKGDRLLEKINENFRAPLAAFDEIIENFVQRREAAQRLLEPIHERIAEGRERLRQWDGVTGPSKRVMGVTLAVVFAAQLPADKLAADVLPLAPALKLIVAITAGALTAWAAHYAGEQVIKAKTAWANRKDDPTTCFLDMTVLGVVIVFPIAFIVVLMLWRSSTLEAFDRATGVTDSSAGNVAFAFFAVVAFIIGVIASIRYQPVAGKYQCEAEIKSYERQAKPLVEEIDVCTQAEAVARSGKGNLEEELASQLARATAFTEQQMSRARMQAGKAERRARGKDDKDTGGPAPDLRLLNDDDDGRRAQGA